jgi:TrmH family RNA methyltransferase
METAVGRSMLDRVVFVLDRPKELANVGAVVRLMGNFGLSQLRLVEPAAFDEDRVLRYASRGAFVAARVKRFPTLDLALADCALVLGATRRERALERPVLSPRQVPPALAAVLAWAGDADKRPHVLAAVLFGPEDFGLSNTALDRCHAIVTIPAVPRDSSLNLAQAAAVVAYEIFAAFGSDLSDAPSAWTLPLAPTAGSEADLAAASDLEPLYDAMSRLFSALHDPPIEGRTNAAMSRMRAMFLRAAPRVDESRLLTTIFEHAARELGRRRK